MEQESGNSLIVKNMKIGSLDGNISRLLFTNLSINNINIEQDSSTLTITFNPFMFPDTSSGCSAVFKLIVNGNYKITSINSYILTEDLTVIGTTNIYETTLLNNIKSILNVSLYKTIVYIPILIINYTGSISIDKTSTRVVINEISNWPERLSLVNTITSS
jgi:hypothetical protein